MNTNKNIAILGFGWLGKSLAVSLHNAGHTITGSTSSLEHLKNLSTLPFGLSRIQVSSDTILGDWEAFMHHVDCLIINIPPKRVPGIETLYPQLMEQIIKRTDKSTKVVFVSSTAVYKASDIPVTENTVAEPSKPSGVAVLAAEQLIQSYFGDNATILRFGGLIGPDRHPGTFLSGKKIVKNPNAQVNLIHRDDCIGLIQEIIAQNCFGTLINGCATVHPLRSTYYTLAAEALELPKPVFVSSTEAQGLKVVDNQKSKELLNYTYSYDDPCDIITTKKGGKIDIIGAGPGNVKLLTLQAFEALQAADVLLHDNLISQEILDVNTCAERVYVGRKYGDKENQSDRQDTINSLLFSYYQQGKKVVRIKSGDPYIYGRAGEEARYLKDKETPFNVIPGISAALAAANTCNIPITERHKSNAVLICTAHTADYSFEQLQGIGAMLKAGNTLALYMGLKSLDKLIPILIEITGDPTIPINAISNVSRSNEVLLTATLATIEEAVKNHKLPMPVVFLIGVKPI
ncbi:MAG: uroporphyrinogen-III C-methyltransferase [Flavobacteriaceae bacterium]|nr:MAG: uroporphyrinogen-III C-methyltransferase [Flavobacteriaceae bacterium]